MKLLAQLLVPQWIVDTLTLAAVFLGAWLVFWGLILAPELIWMVWRWARRRGSGMESEAGSQAENQEPEIKLDRHGAPSYRVKK